MSLFLVILAAGEGKRLKSEVPKPFIIIKGKTVLEHSINAFKEFRQIKNVIVVYNKKHKKYLDKIKIKNIKKILGGKSRQESTFYALKKLKKMKCKKVLIHDAARPCPPSNLINSLLKNLQKYPAVIPIIKVNDATKRIANKIIFKNIKRKDLGFAQTPQGFTFEKIYKKHQNNKNIIFDDDSALFTQDNDKVLGINGSKKNLKITDNEDLKIFESFLKSKIYYGIGFDIHRLTTKRKLYLSGIKIKSPVGTLGHSDGDPVLHATIDAILGACRMGDIGEKFSDKNKTFKNIRSTILLKEIIKYVNYKKYFINNIDINIILEKPKIKKYKKKMINCISKICKISTSQINIKGKTTEKLGIIGKEKAIAAEVIVSVIKND
jgi:2-C-methyl-D-erythritol 4-phosphate cytidylyltransferase / 2-C-methyl-D-erythritol 2,4-cyclodiphosphate synthase